MDRQNLLFWYYRCNVHANIDPTIFFKIKTGIITGGHDFTLVKGRVGWILESILNSRGP